MPGFHPFRGLRYDGHAIEDRPSLDRLVAPPYDVIDPAERTALAARHPLNAVSLILPEGEDQGRYGRAGNLLDEWRRRGVLRQDPEPAFYVLRMTFRDEDGTRRRTVGVLGALALPDTVPGEADGPPTAASVLPHERTLPKAKSDRLALLRATRANLDPIWGLIAAPLTPRLDTGRPADLVATDDDGDTHELWIVDAPDAVASIRAAVESAPVVLADGHHRFETARTYRAERRAAGITDPGDDSIMALIVELATDELCVRSINRIVHDLDPGVDLRARATADGAFDVVDLGENSPDAVDDLRAEMDRRGAIGLVLPDGLSLLVPRGARAQADAAWPPEVAGVDAAVFETAIAPHLASARIEYRNDERFAAALVEKGSADAAYLLRPVTVAQTRAASLAGVRMPQKSTFFFPKPRTGLVFRSLS